MSSNQSMGAEPLPLFELFCRLRAADFPLGVADYCAFLTALQSGAGLTSPTKLRWLCRALFAKSLEDAKLIDAVFVKLHNSMHAAARTIASGSPPTARTMEPARAESKESSSPRRDQNETAHQGPQDLESGTPQTSEAQTPLPSASRSETERSPLPLPLLQGDAAKGEIAALFPGLADTHRASAHVGDYHPISKRELGQCLRRLRRLRRFGYRDELDLDATVASIQRTGWLCEPTLIAGRRNQSELVLLIDCDGSMVPFASLCTRLHEVAQQTGRLRRVDAFRFHDQPPHREDGMLKPYVADQHFVRRHGAKRSTEELPMPRLGDLLSDWADRRPAIIIVSDAGAARGSFDLDRIEYTAEFIERLTACVREFVWLCPVPKDRWAGSSADEIRRFVPMLEMSRAGLERAVDVLQGRPVPGLEWEPL